MRPPNLCNTLRALLLPGPGRCEIANLVAIWIFYLREAFTHTTRNPMTRNIMHVLTEAAG